MKLNIRTKLIAGFGATLILTTAALGLAMLTQKQVSGKVERLTNVDVRISELALESNNNMLMARRSEKDYLLRYKGLGFEEARAKYVTRVQDQVNLIHDHMQEIKTLETHEDGDGGPEAVEQSVDRYEAAFLETVSLLEERGYINTGIEGDFRGKVHDLEVVLEEQGLDSLKVEMLTLRRHEKDYLLRGDQKYIDRLHATAAKLKEEVGAAELGADFQENMVNLASEYENSFDQLVLVDAKVAASIEEFRVAVHETEPLLEELRLDALSHQDAVVAEIRTAEKTARMVVVGFAMGAILLGLLVAWFLSRSISNGVAAVSNGLQRISVGDLTAEVNVHSSDEIGTMGQSYREMQNYLQEAAQVAERIGDGDLTVQVNPRSEQDTLGNAFSRMVTNLRDLVGQVGGTAGKLAQASDQLASSAEQAGRANEGIATASQQVSAGAEQQSQGSVDIANGMTQLSTAIDQVASGSQEQATSVDQASNIVAQVSKATTEVASSAQAAAEGARAANEAAREGSDMVGKTVEGMGRIKAAVDDASQKITDLGDQSAEIGKIVAVIDDIAAQTNLLALNAAIEAARAGEQGRGFAVVADEVRKLAERVTEATKEIANLIDVVQKGVAESVKATEEGTKEVEDGSQLAEEAGKTLSQIMSSVQSVAEQIEQISAAAEEVSASSDEMVKNIESVSGVTEQNSAATEQMAANSTQVSQSVENISGIIEQNSAAIQEMSASTQEVTAQVQEVVGSSQELDRMAKELQEIVGRFNTADTRS